MPTFTNPKEAAAETHLRKVNSKKVEARKARSRNSSRDNSSPYVYYGSPQTLGSTTPLHSRSGPIAVLNIPVTNGVKKPTAR